MLKEQEIWAAFRAGNSEALLKIYDLFYDTLYAYGVRISRNKALTEDYLQDIFVELWERRHTLPEVHSPKAYMMKILKRKHLKNFNAGSFVHSAEDEHYAFSLLDASKEEEIIAREEDTNRSNIVALALQKLTSRQREVIYLKFFQGLSYTEIAEITGLTHRRIYNIVHESVSFLRTSLFTFSRYVALVVAATQLF